MDGSRPPRSREVSRFLRVTKALKSIVVRMYTRSLSVLVQAVLVISVGPLADNSQLSS